MGEIEQDASYWESVQDEYRVKYGNDVHVATLAIMDELLLSAVSGLLNEMRDVWNEPNKQHSGEAMVCEYADCCVSPEGIVGFERRMEDLKLRYDYTEESQPIIRARQNRIDVEQYLEIDPHTVETTDFGKEIHGLGKYEF